jgi:molecular chaperone GrpE
MSEEKQAATAASSDPLSRNGIAADAAETPIDSPTAAEAGTNEAAGESQRRVAELEAEVAKAKDQALRAMAEAENARRRAQRELEERSQFALASFARDLLSAPDNLRRALDALPVELRKQDERFESFAAGVELTERELLSVLERHGIKRIEAHGKPFDHNLHQAIAQIESPDHPSGTVAQVVQPGYTINGRLLRPAMVAVSKGSATQPGAKVDTTA